MKKKAAKGSTRKHASVKHHATRAKHHPKVVHPVPVASGSHVHTVAKHPHHAKPRGLALAPGDAECCAAEALAASLRLAGGTVSDEDVLALHWLAGGDVDVPVPIWAALEVAAEHGLAGRYPVFDAVAGHVSTLHPYGLALRGSYLVRDRTPLILGVDLPGPHALYDDGIAWWSWGEPYDPSDFPGAVIEEAWAVKWAPLAGGEVMPDVSYHPCLLLA